MTVIEYVASGMGFTRLNSRTVCEGPELSQLVYSAANKLHDNGHKFSCLYNAHTEHYFGERLRKYPQGSFENIYADSGGLQVVTQGLDITQKLKDDVYVNQGTWADKGMCFDEIPLKFSGGRSSRLDLSNRWFDAANFEHLARLTGKNVNDQINKFRELDSQCKPVIIIQGNDYDTYMRWCEYLYDEVSVENRPFIGGVAMGAAALGHGALEDIRRAFYYMQLPIDLPSNHMHLLAVGSVKRLIPNLIFINNGYYKDIHLSYDSTTHTSGPHNGQFFSKEGKVIRFTRHAIKTIHSKMLSDIQEVYPEYDVTVEEFFDGITGNLKTVGDKYNDGGKGCIKAFLYDIFANIYFFTREVNAIATDLTKMSKYLDRKESTPYNSLSEVQTLDDFNAWERTFRRFLTSKPVQSEKPLGLDDFFGEL